jgi:hypothetical protein
MSKQENIETDIINWVEYFDIEKSKKMKEDSWKEEIAYFFKNTFVYPVKSFLKGINNLIKWRKIIWQDRWWDYYFLLEILHFKLKDMEENWGKNTHYVNDYKDKDIIKSLIDDLEWMLDDDNELNDGYLEEYKKRSKRFFGRLDRGHRKLWD